MQTLDLEDSIEVAFRIAKYIPFFFSWGAQNTLAQWAHEMTSEAILAAHILYETR